MSHCSSGLWWLICLWLSLPKDPQGGERVGGGGCSRWLWGFLFSTPGRPMPTHVGVCAVAKVGGEWEGQGALRAGAGDKKWEDRVSKETPLTEGQGCSPPVQRRVSFLWPGVSQVVLWGRGEAAPGVFCPWVGLQGPSLEDSGAQGCAGIQGTEVQRDQTRDFIKGWGRDGCPLL